MHVVRHCLASTMLVLAALGGSAPAQAQPGPQAEHFAAARSAAGSTWQAAADYFAMTREQVDSHLPGHEDPVIEPVQVFDNLYALGLSGTVVWALATSDGIVLLDCLYADTLDTVVLPALRQLGLDPATINTVLIAHGHGDHAGAAPLLQERYGTRIGVSLQDWELLEAGSAPVAKRDLLLEDGKPVKVGDTVITPVFTPGHTPGGMGFVFEVSDHGERHTAALFGGTMLTATLPLPTIEQYLAGIEHFAWVTSRAGVDVEIHNHPLMDDLLPRLAALKTREPGASHPLVVGADVYQDFLTVMYESMLGQLARRGEL